MERTQTLTIFTTHFGTNFSGGSTATCEIFSRIESSFTKIIVVGTELGQHPFSQLTFMRYRNTKEAISLLKQLHQPDTIFYGDFYNAWVLAHLKLPYYFTYHDNWPELGQVSFKFRAASIFYWTIYKNVFRHALHVVTVSQYKKHQVLNFTNRVSLIRNGVGEHLTDENPVRKNIVMVGTIDERKYSKAVELFQLLPKDPGFTIDIYGHTADKKILELLANYSYIHIKGHVDLIPYQQYKLLLHTSLMENLSIVWCESIVCATPVLSFNVGAASEVITPNFGRLITAYDTNAMARNLNELNNQPMSINNASSVVRDYSWEDASKQYKELMSNHV